MHMLCIGVADWQPRDDLQDSNRISSQKEAPQDSVYFATRLIDYTPIAHHTGYLLVNS